MNGNDPLTRYLRDVRRFPLLSMETEAELVRRWRDDGDRTALEHLVGSYQRLVVKIASAFRHGGLPLADLVSEGNIGVLQAIHTFDAERGYRLSTFAMWWIRATISDYVVRSSSPAHIVTTQHRRKPFFDFHRMRQRHHPANDDILAPEAIGAIASEMQVPETEVPLMDRHLADGSG